MIPIDFETSEEWQRRTPEQRAKWGRGVVASRIVLKSREQGLAGQLRDSFAMREWMSAYSEAAARSGQSKDLHALSQVLWINFIAVATRGFSVVEEFAQLDS
ncbi:hypothetical protein J8J14_14025 [Roseomonas sp. SSH11]|uniref:Uncharacterized protein n=1 Tax=Pararoseomonas baculiformis TaxID=2820812 RepID=A0ABS4AFT1_9PROT|nr:hypothetical protein [Pararoseomonas baculiformis]MBP0445890.1 hypothetical protein [Pararoseomonas baculiformis]